MRKVILLAYPGVQLLDLVGPLEIFSAANTFVRRLTQSRLPYDVRIATKAGRAVTSSCGLPVQPNVSLAAVTSRFHTLLVPGALDMDPVLSDRGLVMEIRRVSRRAERLVSVCSGAFLLAEAGLLNGKTVTTHWAGCVALAARYPNITVQPDPIFVRDGNVYTSAGVTAGVTWRAMPGVVLWTPSCGTTAPHQPGMVTSNQCVFHPWLGRWWRSGLALAACARRVLRSCRWRQVA